MRTRTRRRRTSPRSASAHRSEPAVNGGAKGSHPRVVSLREQCAMDARGDVWTARRVAEVIAKTFGVRYHRDHVGKLIREAGWSRQKPVEPAGQRNARGAQAVVGGALAPDQKKPTRTKRPSTVRDEAGFIRLSMAVRTWAPRGQTPVLRAKLTRDHLICASVA